ncbi:MAG: HlyC/CorC family transporter [Gammaproteobacteria bacterium]|nr:HlyC/CorC family transporter [Gammaproteobacteria bacterium]
MNDIPTWLLFTSLVFLIGISGFFSGSETGLISLNRYKLRHLEKSGHAGARRATNLLKRPDRLIGLILLGNNFVNILASAIATIIGLRLFGESGIAIATFLLTIVILIFAEVTPKTLAALHPERFAFPASHLLAPMLRLFYPLVWLINLVTNLLLRPFGIRHNFNNSESLSREELRTVVNEAGALIPRQHQDMLVSILDLEQVTVNDIMVPRNEIVGIDLDDDWSKILNRLTTSQHTRLLIYRSGIDNVVGIVHVRNLLHLLSQDSDLNKEQFMEQIREAYFVPENTPLHTQLLNFRLAKRRIGLVVNEYGDLQGLVTMEDILEEIVGEFTTDPAAHARDIHPQDDGSYMVDGSASIRDLNRALNLELPTDGPKTLNGMILEYLETIPEPGTSLKISGYPLEILQTSTNSIKTVRISPQYAQHVEQQAPVLSE